jgi:Bardet-Biedl syndrome 9 protein
LRELFEEILGFDVELKGIISNPNILSFRYHNGSEVTILLSKNAGKYRIQSHSFQSLWFMLYDLIHRLNAFYSKDEGINLLI